MRTNWLIMIALLSPVLLAAISAFECDVAYSQENATELSLAEQLVLKGRAEDNVVACVACHRATGRGDAGSAFGDLTGLSKAYIAKQLNDYRTGKRQNRVMQVIAWNLKNRDIAALSTYYSRRSVRDVQLKIPEAPRAGVVLAERGDETRGLAACTTCHRNAKPNKDDAVPNIFGQHALYITNQLSAWQDGSRKNDPDSVMAEISKKLTPLEISALSIYFARRSRAGD